MTELNYVGYIDWINSSCPVNLNIITLNVSHHIIKYFVDLTNLPNLKHIYCNHCLLESLNGIENLENLETLNCSSNKLKSGKCLKNLKKLKSLNISNNQIDSLKCLKNLENLENLNANNNKIESMEGIHNLKKLIILNISGNIIKSLVWLSNLENLELFNVSKNKLNNLNGINNLPSLLKFMFSNNNINSLDPLNSINSMNLTYLDCSKNKLKSLKSIAQFQKLQYLNCSINEISNFYIISNLIELKNLNISENCFTNIDNFHQLSKIQNFDCSINFIKSLDSITMNNFYLKNLNCSYNDVEILDVGNFPDSITNFDCNNNLIREYKNMGWMYNSDMKYNFSNNRVIPRYRHNRADNRADTLTALADGFYNEYGYHGEYGFDYFLDEDYPLNKNNLNVYEDDENTHDPIIEESIRTSILNIMNVLKNNILFTDVSKYISKDKILNNSTKNILQRYLEIHEKFYLDKNGTSLISFVEIMLYVFNRIETYQSEENKIEIKNIINKEINETLGICISGKISRLVSYLDGFDPLVRINISENQQISYIMTLTKKKLEKNNSYTVDNYKLEVKNEMLDRKYSDEKIKEWIDQIE